MANFNLSIDNGVLLYKDAAGVVTEVGTAGSVLSLLSALIAPVYSKKNFSAGDLCIHDGKLYTAKNNITAENWTASHWTETTVSAMLQTKADKT